MILQKLKKPTIIILHFVSKNDSKDYEVSSNEKYFVEEALKISNPIEVLDYYRNCYFDKNNTSERGLVANAINKVLYVYEGFQEYIYQLESQCEQLKKENEILSINADTAFQEGLNESQELYAEQVKTEIKSEAIKEFAEQVKMAFYYEFDELIPSIMADKIDNLLKEMVGEERENRI